MKKAFSLCLAILVVCALGCSYDSDNNRPETCDHTNYKTFCDNDILVSCSSDDRLLEEMCERGCNSSTLQCNGGSSGECGSIDSIGMCEGNVAKKCVDGKLQAKKCDSGTSCGKRSDGQVDCVDSSGRPDNPDDPPKQDTGKYVEGVKCPSDVTYDGICDGNRVVYCDDDNKIAIIDCKSSSCLVKTAYAAPFAECYEECGSVGFEGVCTAQGYDYCHEKEGLVHMTCDSGTTCQLSSKKIYECL